MIKFATLGGLEKYTVVVAVHFIGEEKTTKKRPRTNINFARFGDKEKLTHLYVRAMFL